MTAGPATDAFPFYEDLTSLHYKALWKIQGAVPTEPVTTMVPHLWPYPEVRALILQAGDIVTAEEANRRVLGLNNPGTPDHDVARATDTLWAGIQLVLPGEVAPVHRHTPAAIRFVIEGNGGYTTVDDIEYQMHPGDLILTPNWRWHGHGHTGDGPMIWLDGLDLALTHSLHATFAEFTRSDEPLPEAVPEKPGEVHAFPFPAVRQALDERRGEPGDPYDDILIPYRNPATGGPLMPTLTAAMQLLRPGVVTAAHRHTHSVVYHVVSGCGASVIGGRAFQWTAGDTFAVPIWTPHQHLNPSSTDAVLFSFSDAPVYDALGLSRETSVGDRVLAGEGTT